MQSSTEIAAFNRDFPELFRQFPGQWVAYYRTERLEIGPSKTEVFSRCYARGYEDSTLFVAQVQPDMAEAYASWEES